jgi:hypothetical protein
MPLSLRGIPVFSIIPIRQKRLEQEDVENKRRTVPNFGSFEFCRLLCIEPLHFCDASALTQPYMQENNCVRPFFKLACLLPDARSPSRRHRRGVFSAAVNLPQDISPQSGTGQQPAPFALNESLQFSSRNPTVLVELQGSKIDDKSPQGLWANTEALCSLRE